MNKPNLEDKTITNKSQKSVTILKIKLNGTPKLDLLSQIQEKLVKKEKFYIVTPNPEIIIQAQSDPELTYSLNSADFSIPDGVGLKLAAPSIHIIKGRELFIDLLQLANTKNLKVYILSKEQVINRALLKIKSQYPNIKVRGQAGPWLNKKAEPISERDISLQSEIVKDINSFKPDLLFVAFGAPKQEIWISKFKNKVNATGLMTIGGALDYYSGFVRPVPTWLSNFGLEWLWRMFQEPKRFKRILNATIVFPIAIIRSAFQSKNRA